MRQPAILLDIRTTVPFFPRPAPLGNTLRFKDGDVTITPPSGPPLQALGPSQGAVQLFYVRLRVSFTPIEHFLLFPLSVV